MTEVRRSVARSGSMGEKCRATSIMHSCPIALAWPLAWKHLSVSDPNRLLCCSDLVVRRQIKARAKDCVHVFSTPARVLTKLALRQAAWLCSSCIRTDDPHAQSVMKRPSAACTSQCRLVVSSLRLRLLVQVSRGSWVCTTALYRRVSVSGACNFASCRSTHPPNASNPRYTKVQCAHSQRYSKVCN